MQNKNRKKQMAEINVVPYIDVMLVLLIIFMITAPLLTQGVKVDLPKAEAKVLSTKNNEPIVVSVDAHGDYFLNISADPAVVISVSSLQKDVVAALQKNPKRQVLVKGDKNVNYGKVVQAMVLLQRAGAASVGLMTTNPNKKM